MVERVFRNGRSRYRDYGVWQESQRKFLQPRAPVYRRRGAPFLTLLMHLLSHALVPELMPNLDGGVHATWS